MDDKSTKDKNIVIARIEHLTKLMCEYFGINEESLVSKDGISDDEFEDLAQNFVSDEVAYQSLMLVSDCPYCSFDVETLIKMDDWLKKSGNKQILEDCKYYKAIVTDCGISDEDENLPLYIYAVKYIDKNKINIDIDEWLTEYKEVAFANVGKDEMEEFETNKTIVLKQREIVESISEFIERKAG